MLKQLNAGKNHNGVRTEHVQPRRDISRTRPTTFLCFWLLHEMFCPVAAHKRLGNQHKIHFITSRVIIILSVFISRYIHISDAPPRGTDVRYLKGFIKLHRCIYPLNHVDSLLDSIKALNKCMATDVDKKNNNTCILDRADLQKNCIACKKQLMNELQDGDLQTVIDKKHLMTIAKTN